MNVNLYVIEDYKNETTLSPKKTNPIQTQTKPIDEKKPFFGIFRLYLACVIKLLTESCPRARPRARVRYANSCGWVVVLSGFAISS